MLLFGAYDHNVITRARLFMQLVTVNNVNDFLKINVLFLKHAKIQKLVDVWKKHS